LANKFKKTLDKIAELFWLNLKFLGFFLANTRSYAGACQASEHKSAAFGSIDVPGVR
jgi:hypothetical protein